MAPHPDEHHMHLVRLTALVLPLDALAYLPVLKEENTTTKEPHYFLLKQFVFSECVFVLVF